jgi:putative tryptophan/tyrosine transport system substrate-binding protein
MRRRKFIALVSSAAVAWPLAARAQQALPVIGVINSGTSAANAKNVTVLRQALKEAGFVDRESVVIEFRWAENHLIGCRGWFPI